MRKKHKRHPSLPNGFGNITYLGKNRRKPYAVYPPSTERYSTGHYKRPKAICYTTSWLSGVAVLNAYHAGTYRQGDELKFENLNSESSTDEIIERILSDYRISTQQDDHRATFTEVYDSFINWKFKDAEKPQNKRSMTAAYKHCESLYDLPYESITYQQFQDVVDSCDLKKATRDNIVLLLKQMGKYAVNIMEIAEKSRAEMIKSSGEENEHGVPFTDGELRILWENASDQTVSMLLIMCYSGYRISAYRDMEVNLSERYFLGGVKTKTSKERKVPIHSAIMPLVEGRSSPDVLGCSTWTFRQAMYQKLEELGIQKHTPHDCRHTFSRLCEKYEVKENDRKRMLGHSFGNDITNSVYGHRDVEELRIEIEKIKVEG